MIAARIQHLDETLAASRSLRLHAGGVKLCQNESEPVSVFEKTSSTSDPVVQLLTVRQTAELLGISIPGVRRLQERRRLAFIKVGGSVRFAMSDIVSYLEKQRVEALDT
jgi:excisionase family DNA binding protein